MAIHVDGNAHEAEFVITRKNASTGAVEAAAGLTLRVKLAATPDGAAIDATLDVALAERASLPGTYYGIIPGTDINTQLDTATYLNDHVWEVVYDSGGNIHAATRQPVTRRAV